MSVRTAGNWRKNFVRLLSRFHAAENGNIAVIFALTSIPVIMGAAAALDYSRANAAKALLQSALDSALLAGAKDGSSSWASIALNVFNGNLESRNLSISRPAFNNPQASTYVASVAATIPTSMLGIMGINSINLTANASATAADADNSCILTLDQGQPSSHVSLTLNGAPVVNLSGCSIRSNTSLNCNGHDGGVTKSYASGAATSCGRPTSNAATVPDTYADMVKNISSVCGGARLGLTWNPGTLPTGAAIKTVSNPRGYVEYHICGDLTLSGSGALISAPSTDVIVVIENGSLIIDDRSSISTVRTTIVLTGDNNWPAQIKFPNGNGKSASLSLSPSISVDNPWQGVAVYLDPRLTRTVDNSWGPGASFNADGLVYLGNSNVVTDGNTASANSKCTKFVMNSFVTNGSVTLDFAQQNCAVIGLKQWGGIVVHLTR
jgi:hypothetical protein